MNGATRTVHQLSHQILRRMLRTILREHLACGRVGSVACRATAALYTLLLEHPVDRRGRCSSCRTPGAVAGHRRRRCRIHRTAQYWLHQPGTALVSSLARELGLSAPPPVVRPEPDWPSLTVTGRSDPDDTDVLPRIEAEPAAPQAPAVSPPSPPPTPTRRSDFPGGDHSGSRRPEPDQGGAGVCPEAPRPRPDPPGGDAPSGHGTPALVIEMPMPITRGALCRS